MKRTALTVAFLVLLSAFVVTIAVFPEVRGATLYVGGVGPGNYTTIQAAIDDVNPGDTVFVYNGTYSERLEVGVSLSLTGENRDTTIVDGGGSGTVVRVTANWTNVSGFTLTNSGKYSNDAGLELYYVQDCRITDINASKDGDGISLIHSDFNSVTNNTVTLNNHSGIELQSSDDNVVSNNYAFWNNRSGVYLSRSRRTTLSDNIMVGDGIRLYGSSFWEWASHQIDTSNIVNGRPIYYWKTINGAGVPADAGQVILVDCTDVRITDQNLSNVTMGIDVVVSAGTIVSGNTISNARTGVEIISSQNSVLTNNAISGKDYGIRLVESHSSIVVGNNVTNGGFAGIYIYESNGVTIANNTGYNNTGSGLTLRSSHDTTIVNNSFVGNGEHGMYLWGSTAGSISGNKAFWNSEFGIYLRYSNNNTVRENEASYNEYGIFLYYSDNNTVENCTTSHNDLYGTYLAHVTNSTVANGSMSNNGYGLILSFADNITVTGNDLSHNRNGIKFSSTTNSRASDNNMTGGGLFVWGDALAQWNTHTIEASNTVNGRPVLYWKDVTGGAVPVNVSEVILANCRFVTVKDQIFADGSVGVEVGFSSSISIVNNSATDVNLGIYLMNTIATLISGNAVTGAHIGIDLWEADGATVVNNTVSLSHRSGIEIDNSRFVTVKSNTVEGNNWSGILSWGLDDSQLTDNVVLWNGHDGISLLSSDRNLITNNTLGMNRESGVGLRWSDDHQVYHNDFIGNGIQAFDDWNSSQWDNGYPSGGNYWSDYVGNDSYSGPGQNISGSDGIGDSPYILDNDSRDNYPLMTPFRPVIPEPPGSVKAVLSGPDFENVTLSWTLSPDDGARFRSTVGYDIYRNGTYEWAGFGYQLIASVVNGTSTFVDSQAGDGDGNDYFYRICAVDGNNTTACTSIQAAKFTRPLAPGPNLVSIPLIQSDERIETVLQTVQYDKAWYYDSVSQEWKWYMESKTYRRELWSVNHTMGIWVNVTQNCNLTVAGTVPAQTTIHLHQGWNLVSFPSVSTSFTVADLKASLPVERVEGFDPAPPHFLRVLSDSDVLLAGRAYWVRVQADVVWNVPFE